MPFYVNRFFVSKSVAQKPEDLRSRPLQRRTLLAEKEKKQYGRQKKQRCETRQGKSSKEMEWKNHGGVLRYALPLMIPFDDTFNWLCPRLIMPEIDDAQDWWYLRLMILDIENTWYWRYLRWMILEIDDICILIITAFLQVAIRANYLEAENERLKEQLKLLRQENLALRSQVASKSDNSDHVTQPHPSAISTN